MPTVLMTGGHSGLGLQVARDLASRVVVSLVLTGRELEEVERSAQVLQERYGISVKSISLDVASLKSVRSESASRKMLRTSSRSWRQTQPAG
jgi:short-subunit dehydrogenase